MAWRNKYSLVCTSLRVMDVAEHPCLIHLGTIDGLGSGAWLQGERVAQSSQEDY